MIRMVTKGAQVFVDMLVLSLAYWLAFLLRFEFHISFQFYKLLFFTWPYVLILQYLMLSLFGVPRIAWRYVGLREMARIIWPLAIASGILLGFRIGLVNVGGYSKFVIIPMGVLAMHFVLSFLGISGARVARRMLAERVERTAAKGAFRENSEAVRTLLVGAGRAGVMVAKEVLQNPQLEIEVVGFVDDDPTKLGTIIQGTKVLGDAASIKQIAHKTRATQAVITIASATGSAIRSIVEHCERANLPVKIIPGIHEILGGRVNLSRIREVTIADLLGRAPVKLDTESIGAFIKGKCVLITGAGGSIGQEICRQVCRFEPTRLVLLEQAENALYHIHMELSGSFPDVALEPAIADITDTKRLDALFAAHHPQLVFHAAAHKHVPMMEWNPGEAIKNNVFGTKAVVDAADAHGVFAFVMISTDKAVNPTSIMGTTKRCAELYVQGKSTISKTKFVAVRFGNVLGSAGSVIPLFKEQIAKGGPVTVTHKEMKRYFMTIPEACQLVMQAATMGKSGDIFVLDMGEPVYIRDLAKDLIRLSGFAPGEIEIRYTGLRPGEKLFEELAVDGENITKTRHPKIFIGKIASTPIDELMQSLERLHQVVDGADNDTVRQALAGVVPEMRPPDTD